ncbi:MAG TPA: DUF5668 domain-containing protein [Candidatus Acidoferrales bacterium]
MSAERKSDGQLWGGIFLIVIGAVFLLDRFDMFNFGWAIRRFWPLIIIAFGVWHLVKRPPSVVPGLLFIAIGAIFQGDRLNFMPYWWSMRRLWPLIPIAIGVALLIERMRRPAMPPPPPPQGQMGLSTDEHR